MLNRVHNHFDHFYGRGIQARAAWTLVELMMAIVTGTVVLSGVVMTFVFVAKSFVIMTNYHDLDKQSRETLDYLSRDIRSISNITVFTSGELAMVDMAGNQIDYKWDGSKGFTRTANGDVRVMLQDCDYFELSNYQRNASNNFSFLPASSVAQTKLIDVRWHCWRPVLGAHLTTESVQTAKFVVRNF